MFDRAHGRSTALLALTLTAALGACTAGPPPAGDAAPDATTDATTTDAVVTPGEDAVTPGADAVTPGADAGPDVVIPPGGPTYWANIAPILNSRCVSCHTAGGIGPMPLTTYEEARPFAPLLAMETGAQRMPPFLADATDCRPLQANPRLTPAQIALFEQWRMAGAPEGDRADYVAMPVVAPARPLPATPDFTVRMPAPYTPNFASPDDTRCFVINPNLTQTQDIVGLRVNAGNPRIVHHVILYEVREAALTRLAALEARDPQAGYSCFGSPGIDTNVRAGTGGDIADFDTQWIGSWAPGGQGGLFPAGTGIRVKPNSRIVMEIHYNRTSAAVVGQSDQSSADLFYSPEPVARQAFWLPIPETGFNVPAGVGPTDPRAQVTSMERIPLPVQVYGVAPHMHTRGFSMTAGVVNSSGTETCMMNVPRWNFGWQSAFWFNAPMRASTTSSLRFTCKWDNTEANQPVIDGVRVPPHALRWGESTDAEMCLLMVYASL